MDNLLMSSAEKSISERKEMFELDDTLLEQVSGGMQCEETIVVTPTGGGVVNDG